MSALRSQTCYAQKAAQEWRKNMDNKERFNFGNIYEEDDLEEVDLPRDSKGKNASVEPLPESSRPRKDGPGGE